MSTVTYPTRMKYQVKSYLRTKGPGIGTVRPVKTNYFARKDEAIAFISRIPIGYTYGFALMEPWTYIVEFGLKKTQAEAAPRPILERVILPSEATPKKVHYWPEGPPDEEDLQHLWCKTPIGTTHYQRYCGDPPTPLNYRWTKDFEKVTCKRCIGSKGHAEMRVPPSKVRDRLFGVVEI